jgi:AraC-like DNA-binding protein
LESLIRIDFTQPGSSTFADGITHQKAAPCLIIAEALQGRYAVTRGNERVETNPGEVFLASTGEQLTIVHHGDPHHGGQMKAHWLHAHYTLLEALDCSKLLRVPLAVRGPQGRRISEVVHALHQPADEAHHALQRIARRAELALRVLRLVCEVSEVRPEALEALRFGTRFTNVFQFIRKNLAYPVSIEDLAKAAHLSPSRFHALFRDAMGLSPMRYVKLQRLQVARSMLLAGEASMEQIASATGFANPFHFSREFRSHHGVSPSRYRETHKGLLV